VTTPVVTIPAHIEWSETKCSICLSCVVVCAERHTGTSTPSRAHIHILVDLLLDSDVSARYCRQCVDAACAEACPEDAIALDETVRAWLVDEEKCMVCGACVDACPYEAIVIDQVTDAAAKCDLCGGAVRCVEICPTAALVLVSA
jgi:anaerobic carbon-monoxide dehydrogenase iron sulfur subunit